MKTKDQIPVLLKQGPTDNWLVNYRSKIILHMKPIASKKILMMRHAAWTYSCTVCVNQAVVNVTYIYNVS